jgi:hypothetical protein
MGADEHTVAIVYNFVHRWYRLKKAFPLAERRRPSRSLTFRVVIFSLYSGATTVASFMLLTNIPSPVPYMIQASCKFTDILLGLSSCSYHIVPLAAFVVFATQQDIIFTWLPWERPKEEEPSGPLVADRKMSSASAQASYPHTPTSPMVNVSWNESTWQTGLPQDESNRDSIRSSTDTVRVDQEAKEDPNLTPRGSADTVRPPQGLERSFERHDEDSPV